MRRPKYNITTLGMTTRPIYRRYPVASILLGLPVIMFSLMVTITIGVGFAQAIGSDAGPGQITIQRTGSALQDCETFATADHYAPDVCEGLAPSSQSAILSCAAEVAYGQDQVDCPKR